MTSAVLPSSEQKPSGSFERLPSFSSEARSLTGIAFTLRSILFSRPERTLPGPTSTKTFTPWRISSRAACVNLTGAVSCSTSSAAILCAGSIFAVTVDMNGAIGSENLARSSAGRRRSAARATSGLWNAPETRSLTVRRAPSRSASLQHSSTDGLSPGDDDLAGAVVVRRPHVGDLARRAPRRPRRRARGSPPSSRGSRAPPRPSPGRARGRARSRRRSRAPATAASAANSPTEWPTTYVRLDAALAQRGQHGEARRDERRLLHLGLHELLLRRLEAEAHEVEAGGLARALVDLHRLRHGLGDLPAHARLERALAREAKCDLRRAHPSPPAVHSIKPEPHVRPAPIPVINTSCPARSLPSASASASASGIEPDEVLP